MNSTRSLPRYIVVKSVYNNKYLQYIKEDHEQAMGKLLQFTGEEVLSPQAKYHVIKANTPKGSVHLRCCYNNKYWVRSGEDQNLIVAGAKEPEEDQSKWSCTLFEPVYLDADTVRFRHVQLGHYVCLWRTDHLPHNKCLSAARSASSLDINDDDRCDIFTIIDRELLMILPKYIAFKGDNGKYLTACIIDGLKSNQFQCDDIRDPRVHYEVFTIGDGSVVIKSTYFNLYWRIFGSNYWISPITINFNKSPSMSFCPVKVNSDNIVLRSLALNKFCKRYSADSFTDCLSANIDKIDNISKEAYLKVEELVLSREIYDVKFRLEDARIYKQSVLTMATGTATNETHEPNTIDLKLSYSETKSSTWTSNVSMTLGIKTTIETGIPFLVKGRVEISAEFTGSYEWGETNESTNVVEIVYHVIVPPMSAIKVSLLATKGSCDVPFSYTQRDINLINGKQMVYDMDGGVYTGINCFNFTYETHPEPM